MALEKEIVIQIINYRRQGKSVGWISTKLGIPRKDVFPHCRAISIRVYTKEWAANGIKLPITVRKK